MQRCLDVKVRCKCDGRTREVALRSPHFQSLVEDLYEERIPRNQVDDGTLAGPGEEDICEVVMEAVGLDICMGIQGHRQPGTPLRTHSGTALLDFLI